jgi:hypothetical protein
MKEIWVVFQNGRRKRSKGSCIILLHSLAQNIQPPSTFVSFTAMTSVAVLFLLAAAKRELSWTLNGGVREEVSFGMEWTSFASS